MAKIVVLSGEAEQREYRLGDATVLGRSPDCDITIAAPDVSRQHATVTRRDESYVLEDRGSANGTAVNGRFVTSAHLRDGDWVEIGQCRLTFLLDDDYVLPRAASLFDDATATVVEAVDMGKTLAGLAIEAPATAEALRTHLAVLRELAEASCGMLEIERLIGLALRRLLGVYSHADHACAVLFGQGEGGKDLQLSTARGEAESPQVGMSRTLLERAVERREAVLAADVGSDAELRGAASIVAQNVRSIMCCPLMVGEECIGAIQVDTASAAAPFNGDDLRLLATIAGQVAVAAQNARLHGEVVAQQRLAAVGEAVSSLAHCIKNVLNGLKGGAYVLDLGVKKDSPQQVARGWEMVKRNTDFMSQLVLDMLAYCRRSRPQLAPTDVAELLDDVVLMVAESAAREGIEVSAAVQAGLPALAADAVALKRAVLNLLTNALDACPEGSTVRVGAEMAADDGQLQITVRDDGPGIPEQVLERLFEPFFTTKGSRGTGLGLPLVRKVAEQHGGRVEVESEAGRGTAFHIMIPLAGDQETTAYT